MFESVHDTLFRCPEQVMLCVLPSVDPNDLSLNIHHKLIEAYCWENSVNVVKVRACVYKGISYFQNELDVSLFLIKYMYNKDARFCQNLTSSSSFSNCHLRIFVSHLKGYDFPDCLCISFIYKCRVILSRAKQ